MQATRKQSSRSRGQAKRHRLIYRLSVISAAETDGARRNRARRQCGDTVARGVAGEKEMRVSEGEEATGQTDRAAGRARPVGRRRQVGLARQVGQGWQRER
jgi:hypothetical protein